MVAFMPNDDQKMIRDMARDFAVNELRPKARDCDESDAIPESVLQAGWDLRMVNAVIPAPYGGSGMERSAVTGTLIL